MKSYLFVVCSVYSRPTLHSHICCIQTHWAHIARSHEGKTTTRREAGKWDQINSYCRISWLASQTNDIPFVRCMFMHSCVCFMLLMVLDTAEANWIKTNSNWWCHFKGQTTGGVNMAGCTSILNDGTYSVFRWEVLHRWPILDIRLLSMGRTFCPMRIKTKVCQQKKYLEYFRWTRWWKMFSQFTEDVFCVTYLSWPLGWGGGGDLNSPSEFTSSKNPKFYYFALLHAFLFHPRLAWLNTFSDLAIIPTADPG